VIEAKKMADDSTKTQLEAVADHAGARAAATNHNPEISLQEGRNAAAGEGPNASGSTAPSDAETHIPSTSEPNATDIPSANAPDPKAVSSDNPNAATAMAEDDNNG
jgi:hypothetical protein